jgi:hypothetical protein
MLRTVGGVIVVMGMLADVARAQVPTAAPRRLATLGDPLTPPASSTAPAGRPSPWEDVAPGPGTAVSLPPTATYTGSYTTLPRPTSDPVSVNRSGEALVPSADGFQAPQRVANPYLDNLSLFFGLGDSKEPADLGVNGNFGYRLAVNWGLPLLPEAGLGIQVGSALNYSQNTLRLLRFIDGTVEHWQNFTTVGVFQRAPNSGLRWGVVYDFRFDDYYDIISTGQVRAQLGLEVNPDNEFGTWATFRTHGDRPAVGPLTFTVEPINQWNFYWRHVWLNDIVTRFWIGFADHHSRFNLLVPGQPQVDRPFTFGGDFYVPLTERLALFGEVHFITPNDSGTVAATLGLAWYPGTARGTARSRFAPLLPLANNTTFALDAR